MKLSEICEELEKLIKEKAHSPYAEWKFNMEAMKRCETLLKAARLLEKSRHLLELRKRFPDYVSVRMAEEGPFKMTGAEESLYEEIRKLTEGE